jgi:hypothetical protein
MVVANTEPIFAKQRLLSLKRLQTGLIFPTAVALGLTGSGETLVDCDAQSSGAIIEDIWCLPLGALGAGTFIRFYLSDYNLNQIYMIFEAAIATSGASPFVRQELGTLLPEVLSPTQTGLAGKKKALYLGPNQRISVGLSADLAAPLVVGLQGGYY